MSNWTPHSTGTLGPEWAPSADGSYLLDSMLKAAAFSFDQSLSQQIGTVQVPNVALPSRGGMYAVEVYDNETAVPANVTSALAVPNEDVLIGNWRTQSGGSVSLFATIDEGATPNVADYISVGGNTSRYTGRFNTGSFVALTGKRILAVELAVTAATGPTGRLVAGLNIAATDYPGIFMIGSTSTRTLKKRWTTHPNTGQSWTIAGVTDLDVGQMFYADGSTTAGVWSAVVIYNVSLTVYYCDENRLAVGFLDDRASGLVAGSWNSAAMLTPTGGTWTKDAAGRHLYVVRRVNEQGAMQVPYLDAGPLGAPPIGRGWEPTLHPTYGYATAMGAALTRAYPLVQRTTIPADSVDSQPYDRRLDAVVQTGQTAEQELSGAAATNYSVVHFLVRLDPTLADPDADLLVKVKRRSDNVQLGSTFTLTVAAARTMRQVASGWYYVTAQLATPAALVGGIQYFLELSSTATAARPWRTQALWTQNSGNTATYNGTSDNAKVNGVDDVQYELAATLSTPPPAPATLTVTVLPDAAQVGTGSICCDATTDRCALAWTVTSQGANFLRYEIQRDDGGGFVTVATITVESVNTWSDREARRGVNVTYRIRVVRTDLSISDWRTATPVTRASSNPTLWMVTNYGTESIMFDYQPAKSYDFNEDGERVTVGAYSRDYQLGFNPTEQRGATVHYTLLIALDDRPAAAAPAQVKVGLSAFTQLRRYAHAAWPYVCLLDNRGNRHHVLLRVPSGNEEQPAARYVAEIAGVETRDDDAPVPVTVDASGAVGIFGG